MDPKFANIAARTRQLHEGRHLSRFVDPSELPQRDCVMRRVDEHFWHQSANAAAQQQPSAAKKKRRRQTLARPRRKVPKLTRPAKR